MEAIPRYPFKKFQLKGGIAYCFACPVTRRKRDRGIASFDSIMTGAA